jgi:hypothetical protein
MNLGKETKQDKLKIMEKKYSRTKMKMKETELKKKTKLL